MATTSSKKVASRKKAAKRAPAKKKADAKKNPARKQAVRKKATGKKPSRKGSPGQKVVTSRKTVPRTTAAESRRLDQAGQLASTYMALLSRGHDDDPHSYEVRDLEQQAARLQDELSRTLQRLAKLNHSRSTPVEKSRRRQELVDELVNLLAHPDIRDIRISGNLFIVTTGPLAIQHGSSQYDIGRIEIRIEMHYRAGYVTFRALDHRGPNVHPHINSSGEPCLGNIREALIQLIGQGQLATAAYVCLDFLKSYTRESGYAPYHDISNWPLKRRRG